MIQFKNTQDLAGFDRFHWELMRWDWECPASDSVFTFVGIGTLYVVSLFVNANATRIYLSTFQGDFIWMFVIFLSLNRFSNMSSAMDEGKKKAAFTAVNRFVQVCIIWYKVLWLFSTAASMVWACASGTFSNSFQAHIQHSFGCPKLL